MRRSNLSNVRHCFLHWSKWFYLFKIQTRSHWRAQGLVSENSGWQNPQLTKKCVDNPMCQACIEFSLPFLSSPCDRFSHVLRERLLLPTVSRLGWPWSNHLTLMWKSSRDLGRTGRGGNFLCNNSLNWGWKWTVAVRHCGCETLWLGAGEEEEERDFIWNTGINVGSKMLGVSQVLNKEFSVSKVH